MCTTYHMLYYRKNTLLVFQKGMNVFQTLCGGFKAGGDHKSLGCLSLLIE
jgi:hypothetical protein